MGSWGYTAFEDDSSLDFIGKFSATPSIELLNQAILNAKEAEYIDDEIGGRGLAAAEIVAAINGKPLVAIDDQLKAWTTSVSDPIDALKVSALEIVQRIFEDSELREVWEDSDGLEPWGAAIEDLKSRLN